MIILNMDNKKISVSKLFKGIKIYDKYCYLASIYPAIIYFLERLYEMNKDSYIAFLSRDAYFLYIIYKQLAHGFIENKDYSYIYASKKCFLNKDSSVYKDYILSLLSKKKNLLMVDIAGTGNSYTKFINQYNLKDKNIRLLFFSKWVCYSDIIKDNKAEGFYNTKIGFNDGKNILSFSLECLFRAPNPSVTHVSRDGENFKAHYVKYDKMEKHDRVNDEDKEQLLNLYDRILENMPYHKNIRYFTLNALDYKHNNQTIPINIEKNTYSGLLIFDIDNVLTNVKDYIYANTIINDAINNNIKIVMVTARQWPFSYGKRSVNQKISSIEGILKKTGFNYDKHMIDVWYNPFTFIDRIKPIGYVNDKNVGEVKRETIRKVMDSYSISHHDVIYFDDTKENIDECKKLKINAYLVKRKEGINKTNRKEFDRFLDRNTCDHTSADIKQTIHHEVSGMNLDIRKTRYNKLFKEDPHKRIVKKLIINYTDISSNNVEVEFRENKPIIVNNIKEINKATYGSETNKIDIKNILDKILHSQYV